MHFTRQKVPSLVVMASLAKRIVMYNCPTMDKLINIAIPMSTQNSYCRQKEVDFIANFIYLTLYVKFLTTYYTVC
jgi:hypothetical protein